MTSRQFAIVSAAVVLLAAVVAGHAMLAPRSVTLTIDDGPENTAIDRHMLATLRKHHAHAIWFVTCKNLDPAIDPDSAEHRAVLREIVAEGHTLGNHGYSHVNLPDTERTQPELLAHEITGCSDMIQSITGIRPRYFRPPWGVSTARVRQMVARDDMQIVLWDASTFDSMVHTFKTDPASYLAYLQSHPAVDFGQSAESGQTVLMHDYPNTDAALDGMLTALDARGFRYPLPSQSVASNLRR